MSSTDVELIPSVLSATAGNISRTTSAPPVLLTLDVAPDSLRITKENDTGPFEDVELASSLDGVDAEGVEAWSKLDGMCVVGLEDGITTFVIEGHYRPTNRGTDLRQPLWLGSPSTSG